jgi:D-alanyl-D-alanine carboxypeptidase (penicillin-binding protein 5/6)
VATSLVVILVALQISRPAPRPTVTTTVALAGDPVPGTAPALPWPASGQGAVAVPGRGLLIESGPETPVPIASLTKIMTAYLILHDHPLAPTAQGPGVSMTANDVLEATLDEEDGATSVPVTPGEVLTERQLLNGLLVHSANNFADVLANWDAGSVTAFVARMNAEAVRLGMTHTHYADSNGLNSQSVSTAGDQLRVAMAAMTIPTFAAVVAQTSIVLPIAGEIPNYVSSIGTDGIVGVKSGFTQAAMGCLVMAARRQVSGRTVLVMAAVTGQPGLDPLDAASSADVALIDAAAAALRERPIVADHLDAADVRMAWHRAGVPAYTAQAVTMLAWPGDHVQTTFTAAPVKVGDQAGTLAGTIVVRDGSEQVSVPVRTAGAVIGPSLSWRLTRG